MNKEKYLKWYKLAQEVVNNPELIPERTDKEILYLVSEEDWLMFLIKELSDMKEAKNADKPNVFFSIFNCSCVNHFMQIHISSTCLHQDGFNYFFLTIRPLFLSKP